MVAAADYVNAGAGWCAHNLWPVLGAIAVYLYFVLKVD